MIELWIRTLIVNDRALERIFVAGVVIPIYLYFLLPPFLLSCYSTSSPAAFSALLSAAFHFAFFLIILLFTIFSYIRYYRWDLLHNRGDGKVFMSFFAAMFLFLSLFYLPAVWHMSFFTFPILISEVIIIAFWTDWKSRWSRINPKPSLESFGIFV